MSTTGTQTKTYTKADIRKVIENFAADYVMIADFTGLRSRQKVEESISDLRQFAEDDYLDSVTLYLLDKDGNPLQVAHYRISGNAVGWQTSMPGNNLWTAPEGASLKLVATLSDSWWDKTDEAKGTYLQSRGFHSSWSKTQKEISLAGLNSSAGQKYASNGYGWERTNYSK